MRNLNLPIVAVLAATAVAAADPATLLSAIDRNGIIKVDNLVISPTIFEPTWSAVTSAELKPTAGYPQLDAGQMKIRGEVAFKRSVGGVNFAGDFTLLQTDSATCRYRFYSDGSVACKEVALSVELPVNFYSGKSLRIDGKKLEFPSEFREVRLKAISGVERLEIPTENGALALEGRLDLLIQDNRKWNVPNFSIRIRFLRSSDSATDYQLQLKLSRVSFKTTPIDLRNVVNQAFQDDEPGDRKGGWTDQGDNDLRMMKPGAVTLGGVNFDIVDPAAAAGRSCLVFRGAERPYFLESATVEVPPGEFQALYLLHALAWAPRNEAQIGSLSVAYLDGSEEDIPVRAPEDVGDWYCPANKQNGRVVWTGTNRITYVGLYLSKYKLKSSAVKSVTLKTAGKSVWMVVGISAGDDIPMPELVHSYIVQNEEWLPISNPFQIKSGSILDFSGITPKYFPEKAGRIGIVDGRFEAEKQSGTRLKFYGVNVMHFDEIIREQGIDELVDYIVRTGYNAVRLHHYDHIVADYSNPAIPGVDAEKMRRLDYFAARLKERGLYLSIDLYSMRKIKRGAIPEFDREVSQNEFKALIPISESARRNFEMFAEAVLEHRNEYTGLQWKHDPAIFSICTVNEDNIHSFYASAPPEIKSLYLNKWEKSGKQVGFTRFLTGLGIENYRRTETFLRRLGSRAMTTAVNANLYDAGFGELQRMRAACGYVDNHSYWDHGKYQLETTQWTIDNRSVIAGVAGSPRDVMPSRIFGRPFMITEFDFCSPNHFRSEGGAIFGAYCALQDYDGIFRFCLGYRPDKPIRHFGLAGDPINFLSERIGLLNFLRGDVAASSHKSAVVFDENTAVDDSFTRLGLVRQIGSFPAGESLPAGVEVFSPSDAAEPEEPLLSSTRELELNFDASAFRQVTDRSECLIASEGNELSGKLTRVRFKRGRSTFFIAAMDGKPLGESGRMLLLLLSDVQNSQTMFADQNHNLQLSGGKLPLLVRAVEAEVVFETAVENLVLQAVGLDGAALFKLPLRRNGGRLEFVLRTNCQKDNEPILVFELSQL